jgi:very-short-patch-repair endonuclease
MQFAREQQGRPFYIFHDTVLREIARRRPQTPDELLAVPGVGPVKLERYGEAFLEILRQFGPSGEEAVAVAPRTGETPVPPGITPPPARNAMHPTLPPDRRPLWDALRAARLQLAREVGEKAFSIYPDSILRAMAEARPLTLEALAGVRGAEAEKLEPYAEGMLEALRAHAPRAAGEGTVRSPRPTGDTGGTPVPPEPEPEKDSSVLRIARELRRNPTVAEAVLWEALGGKRLGYKFRRQHPLGEIIVDFYCPAVKVAVLIGVEGESDPRATELRGKGVLVVEVKDTQIEQELEATLRMIRAVCRGAEQEEEEHRWDGWYGDLPPGEQGDQA